MIYTTNLTVSSEKSIITNRSMSLNKTLRLDQLVLYDQNPLMTKLKNPKRTLDWLDWLEWKPDWWIFFWCLRWIDFRSKPLGINTHVRRLVVNGLGDWVTHIYIFMLTSVFSIRSWCFLIGYGPVTKFPLHYS